MPQERDQSLHDQRGLHVRQLDQQQGAVFRLRAGRRDRAQSDFDAHQRGVGLAQGRRCDLGAPQRQLHETQCAGQERTRDRPNVESG